MCSSVKNEQEGLDFLTKGAGQRKSRGIGGHQNRNNLG